MSENYKFLISILLQINHYDDEEDTMISIRQNEPDQFCPLLYQIIKNHDGTFTFQHLEKGTHRTIKTVNLSTENIESAFEKYVDVETVDEIELSWGPYILFSYRIKG